MNRRAHRGPKNFLCEQDWKHAKKQKFDILEEKKYRKYWWERGSFEFHSGKV